MQGQRRSFFWTQETSKTSAPELRWPKFTQNDFFFEKLVLTHPPTFWPGVGNFSFWNSLQLMINFCTHTYNYIIVTGIAIATTGCEYTDTHCVASTNINHSHNSMYQQRVPI